MGNKGKGGKRIRFGGQSLLWGKGGVGAKSFEERVPGRLYGGEGPSEGTEEVIRRTYDVVNEKTRERVTRKAEESTVPTVIDVPDYVYKSRPVYVYIRRCEYALEQRIGEVTIQDRRVCSDTPWTPARTQHVEGHGGLEVLPVPAPLPSFLPPFLDYGSLGE